MPTRVVETISLLASRKPPITVPSTTTSRTVSSCSCGRAAGPLPPQYTASRAWATQLCSTCPRLRALPPCADTGAVVAVPQQSPAAGRANESRRYIETQVLTELCPRWIELFLPDTFGEPSG